jgi:adenylate cyclase
MNRPWFMQALDVTETFMRENPVDKWLGDANRQLLDDIKSVHANGKPMFGSDIEIKTGKNSVIVNYQVMPLISGKGVVLVFDDISAEKRAVMTLGRYMSPALAKQVMEENNGELGGMRKKVSILFSDIRSFTTLSEVMTPPQVVDLLNQHFTDAVNAISEEEGILDKFIGIE